jgi:hypothetical protein
MSMAYERVYAMQLHQYFLSASWELSTTAFMELKFITVFTQYETNQTLILKFSEINIYNMGTSRKLATALLSA